MTTRLVLLSGWGIDKRIWLPLAPYWPSSVTANTLDWPGYGGIPPLRDGASIAELAEAMRDRLPSDAIWVGWSLGGLLATALLDYLPPPRGLILLGAGATFCAPEGVSHAALDDFRQAFQRHPHASWRHFLRWQSQGELAPYEVYQQLRTLLGNRPNTDNTTLANGLHWLATLENRQRLMAASCSVVYLAGKHDPLLSRHTRAQAIQLGNAGHCPQLSHPERLAALLTSQATELSPTGQGA